MLVHGLGWTPGDLGDAWFNHYLLEHSYRAVTGQLVVGSSFWNPPYFYPVQNAHAYGDILLGAMPFYGIWRLLGFTPGLSYQLWIALVSVLNFSVFFGFLKRVFKFESFPASVGAFLFAFGAPRIAQLGHPQLLPQLYSVAALWLWVEFTLSRKWGFILGAALCLSAQFYSGFYLAWFLSIGVLIFVGVSLLVAPLRQKFFSILRQEWKKVFVSAILVLGCVIPLFKHYLDVSREFGLRSWEETMWMVPPLQAWIYQGPDVWLHFWMKWIKFFQVISHEYEQRLGLGLVTTVLIWTGFIKNRREPIRFALFLSFLIFITVITKYPPRSFTFWQSLYGIIPGAGAIRVPSRAVMLFLIPAGVGIASFMATFKSRNLRGALLFALVLFEQGASMPGYLIGEAEMRTDLIIKKYQILATERVQNQQSPCTVFFYSPGPWVDRRPDGREGHPPHSQVAAMWASLTIGLPTYNGYSGRNPGKSWSNLNDPAVINTGDEKRIRQGLFDWSQDWHIDLRDLCWVRG